MTGTDLLIVLATLVVAALGGWPLTAGVLRLAARSADAGTATSDVPPEGTDAPSAVADDDAQAAATRAPAGGDGPTGQQARSALRGGTWIGVLERTAIAGAILAGFPTAVAFVIAVKGLGRYPEIREHPGTSERFVIGTLASMMWAAAVAGLGRAIILGWLG